MPLVRLFLYLVLPGLLIVAADLGGLLVWIGAHPFWSLKGALIGIAIGFAVILVLAAIKRRQQISPSLLLLVFIFVALIAGILMLNGKEGFAVSYARDAAAGRLWYFGYIGFAAAIYATLSALLEVLMVRLPLNQSN